MSEIIKKEKILHTLSAVTLSNALQTFSTLVSISTWLCRLAVVVSENSRPPPHTFKGEIIYSLGRSSSKCIPFRHIQLIFLYYINLSIFIGHHWQIALTYRGYSEWLDVVGNFCLTELPIVRERRVTSQRSQAGVGEKRVAQNFPERRHSFTTNLLASNNKR